jgi:hypothetical protein
MTDVNNNARREDPFWMKLESVCNNICKSVSINESINNHREGKIPIAIDDDKIWMNLSGKNKRDLFQLKYSQHVRDNRKGLIAHTAVSTGLNIPIGITFERSKDKTIDCIKRLLICFVWSSW